MIRSLFAAAAATLVASALTAQTVPTSTQLADEQALLQAIGERGRLLFDLDRAAWVATDELMAKVPRFAESGLKGYVVERDGDGFVVTFYGGETDRLEAAHIVHVAGGRVKSSRSLEPALRTPLTPVQLRLANARSVRPEKDIRSCTRGPFNVAVVPPAGPDAPIEMYLTSPQVEDGVYPFGGHYLLTIAPDGSVRSVRKFTNACLNLSRPEGEGPGGTTSALFVTHNLDPRPTEIHVFMSLVVGQPVMVSTTEPFRFWVVNGDKISGLELGPPPKRGRRRRD